MATETLGTFGKYLLLKKLATGGMAEIFLARPASTDANGRVLVIKRILSHVADDPSFLKMFKSEIRVCMGLNHPNIAQLHDSGEVQGRPYIAMEYIEGRNLKQIAAKFLAAQEAMPIGFAVSVATQAAAGLHYAHTFQNTVTGENLNVIHRDISPHNLLISFDGNVKIIDFGIAKAEDSAMDKTAAGTIKGKACYVSPEQTSTSEIDGRSDIFSLGVVLWEMLVGQKLFAGETDLTILRKVQDCENFIQPPSTFNSAIPSELEAIVMKALAKDPAKRYASAADFQKHLRGFLMSYLHGYSYSDVAASMQKLFKDEIETDRKHVRTLNDQAQGLLIQQDAHASQASPIPNAPDAHAQPVTIESGNLSSSMRMAMSSSAGNLTASMSGFTGPMGRAPESVHVSGTSGVIFLTKFGNRKVTWKHVALLAFYVMTIVGIKLDEKYFFFDRFLIPTEVVRNARANPPQAVTHAPITTADNHKRGLVAE